MHRTGVIFVIGLLAACGKTPDNSWQGYVEGEFVLLASPYAGQLQKLHVRRGDQVAAGKPVFALEQENERAAREEASMFCDDLVANDYVANDHLIADNRLVA